MGFAQPGALRLYILPIVRVVFSHLLPIVPEMALNAVPPLQFQIGLLDLFEQGGFIPCSAVVNDGAIGRGCHRFKIFAVLVTIYNP